MKKQQRKKKQRKNDERVGEPTRSSFLLCYFFVIEIDVFENYSGYPLHALKELCQLSWSVTLFSLGRGSPEKWPVLRRGGGGVYVNII